MAENGREWQRGNPIEIRIEFEKPAWRDRHSRRRHLAKSHYQQYWYTMSAATGSSTAADDPLRALAERFACVLDSMLAHSLHWHIDCCSRSASLPSHQLSDLGCTSRPRAWHSAAPRLAARPTIPMQYFKQPLMYDESTALVEIAIRTSLVPLIACRSPSRPLLCSRAHMPQMNLKKIAAPVLPAAAARFSIDLPGLTTFQVSSARDLGAPLQVSHDNASHPRMIGIVLTDGASFASCN